MTGLLAAPPLLWLQAAPPAGGEPVSFFQSPMFLILALMLIWIYFLTIRPQQRQRREHENMIKSIEKGDTVVTSGGLYGKVTGMTDDVLTLEIANFKGERVRIKQQRGRIDSVEKAKKAEESES